MAGYGLARMVSEVDDADVEYFAYSAVGTTTVPIVYASVSVTNLALTINQRRQNARYIYSYLLNWGFTKNAACGVLGNIDLESDYDLGIWQKEMNRTDLGYGLVQWSPSQDFLDWAYSDGLISQATPGMVNALARSNPPKLMDAELDCLAYDGCRRFAKPSATGYPNHSGYNMTYAQYKKSTYTPETMAVIFCDHFEQIKMISTIPERKESARQWFDIL